MLSEYIAIRILLQEILKEVVCAEGTKWALGFQKDDWALNMIITWVGIKGIFLSLKYKCPFIKINTMLLTWSSPLNLFLIDRVPDELWMEVHDIVQETGIKTIPMKKKCKKENDCLRRPYK